MKKIMCFLMAGMCMIWLAACGSDNSAAPEAGDITSAENSLQNKADGASSNTGDDTSNTENKEENIMQKNTFYVTVGEKSFSATFADNPGAQALKELLADGDITIQMSDYAGFEKVGSLGRSLPSRNSRITTESGDIVLYQGNQIVVFYGSNSWSYTRLGKINDLTGWSESLGSSDVSVTFSLYE